VRPGGAPSDRDERRARIEAALEKHDRGEALSEEEWTVVYWLRYAAGCHACGGVSVVVRPPDPAPLGR